MQNLLTSLNEKLGQALGRIQEAKDLQGLYDVKVSFAGKQGFLSEIMKEMAKLPKEEKPVFGKEVNRAKEAFETAYQARESDLKDQELVAKVQKDAIDVSLPGPSISAGAQASDSFGD